MQLLHPLPPIQTQASFLPRHHSPRPMFCPQRQVECYCVQANPLQGPWFGHHRMQSPWPQRAVLSVCVQIQGPAFCTRAALAVPPPTW